MRSLNSSSGSCWQIASSDLWRPLIRCLLLWKVSRFLKDCFATVPWIFSLNEYSVTCEEISHFPQPNATFPGNTPQDATGLLLLTYGQLIYQDTQILFCKALSHLANPQRVLVWGSSIPSTAQWHSWSPWGSYWTMTPACQASSEQVLCPPFQAYQSLPAIPHHSSAWWGVLCFIIRQLNSLRPSIGLLFVVNEHWEERDDSIFAEKFEV